MLDSQRDAGSSDGVDSDGVGVALPLGDADPVGNGKVGMMPPLLWDGVGDGEPVGLPLGLGDGD